MVAALRLTPGATFAADYEVRELLAEGGMGTVYSVIDRTCGEPRALKVLLPELVADETSRRRFAQEANVAAQIESTHVPRIYRAGIDDATGFPFIAMELLYGKDLRKFIKERGPLSLDEARPILEQLGDALAAAHRTGLVHRDLKPENVFIVETNNQIHVKLLDFGVAKVIDTHRTSALGTGAIGSPLWMSPEQTSAGGRIAPSTDVFAFGLLSFYLFTGTFYWRSAHSDAGVGGLLRELHVDDIEFPSDRVKQIGKDIVFPPGYDEWFVCAVARDGSARFRDGGEALAALRPVLERRARRSDRSQLAFAATMQVSAYSDDDDEPETIERIPRTDPPPPALESPVPPPMSAAPMQHAPMPHAQAYAPMPHAPVPHAPVPQQPAYPLQARSHAYPNAPQSPSPPRYAVASSAPPNDSKILLWAGLFVLAALVTAVLSVVGVWIALTLMRPTPRAPRLGVPAPVAPVGPAAQPLMQPNSPAPVAPLHAGAAYEGTFMCEHRTWSATLRITAMEGDLVNASLSARSIDGAYERTLSGRLMRTRLVLLTTDGSHPVGLAGVIDLEDGSYRGRVRGRGCEGFSFTPRR